MRGSCVVRKKGDLVRGPRHTKAQVGMRQGYKGEAGVGPARPKD